MKIIRALVRAFKKTDSMRYLPPRNLCMTDAEVLTNVGNDLNLYVGLYVGERLYEMFNKKFDIEWSDVHDLIMAVVEEEEEEGCGGGGCGVKRAKLCV